MHLSVKLTIVHDAFPYCRGIPDIQVLKYNEELNGYSAFSADCVIEHCMCKELLSDFCLGSLLSFSGGYGFYFRHLHQTISSSLSSIERVGL